LLRRWNEERRAAARFYSEALQGVGDLELPPVAPASDPVWHLYVIRTAEPRRLADHLNARSIGTGFHYPEPAHLSAAYRSLGYPAGSFPVSERAAARVLSLPMFPGITEAQLEAVVDGVRSYF
jgi:dTDP-4-amino-4,6-dideoxygalactose transaminase